MKKFSAIIIAAFFVASVFAVSVDENELKSVNQTIVFENYTGPHAVVNTLEQIKEIGRGLGRTVAKSVGEAGNAGSTAKYYVIHAIDPSVKEKLDADILILGADAGVDHVRNLRHIIAGYLSMAYGYSEADATTIATFITVYNAVYRQKLDVFQSKYKEVVTKNLSSEKCGLSVKYNEWPGNSQIVIPVSDIAGGLSAIDTSIISDKDVISSMQEDDDKNIEARKDMVDLKERESEDATEKAQEAQKTATEEQRKANEAQKEADKAKEDAAKAQEKADKAQEKADEKPNSKKAQKDAEQAQKEADEAKKNAEELQKKADEAQERADEAKEVAAEKQAIADKKLSEAQEERKNIAQDQQVVEKATFATDGTVSVFGLALANTDSLDSTIVKLNTRNNAIMQKSEVNMIRGRAIYQGENGFIAVAGENAGKGAVKLVIIDEISLTITKESLEILSDNSVLLQDGSEYLVVVQDSDNYVVAKYDAKINLVVKSPVPVSPNTPIVKTSAGYVVTDDSGTPVLLDMGNLKKTN